MSDAWESFDRAAYALEESKSENEQLRALLRELAAAATVYQDAVRSGVGFEARLEAGSDLSEVLARVEAEAGEESAND